MLETKSKYYIKQFKVVTVIKMFAILFQYVSHERRKDNFLGL